MIERDTKDFFPLQRKDAASFGRKTFGRNNSFLVDKALTLLQGPTVNWTTMLK